MLSVSYLYFWYGVLLGMCHDARIPLQKSSVKGVSYIHLPPPHHHHHVCMCTVCVLCPVPTIMCQRRSVCSVSEHVCVPACVRASVSACERFPFR